MIENVVCDLMIESWGHRLDSAQFGGRRGYSVTLYLIKLVDFILKNLDKPKAIMLAFIDYSKHTTDSHTIGCSHVTAIWALPPFFSKFSSPI